MHLKILMHFCLRASYQNFFLILTLMLSKFEVNKLLRKVPVDDHFPHCFGKGNSITFTALDSFQTGSTWMQKVAEDREHSCS